MINLRYHIVSITAVFLALGIGLAFGASFIDRATVNTLERNLNDIEDQNDRLEEDNARLSGALEEAARVEEALREQGISQLVAGRLTDVPVLLLANDGVADDVVAAGEAAVLAAGGRLAGVLRVTDRFALDDDGELEDLRDVLGLPNAGEAQLRRAVTRQVATILREAGAAPVAELEDPEDPGEEPPVVPPTPPLLDALLATGFLELDPVDQPVGGVALVAEAGVRVLALSGDASDVDDDDFMAPVLQGLVGIELTDPEGAPPVVVAAEATAPEPADGADPPPLSLVARLRGDDALRDRISTVDDVETFAGLAAAVLALANGGEGQHGHYGLGDDAQSLLPPAVVATGEG